MFKKFIPLLFLMVWSIAFPAACQLSSYRATVNMFVQFGPSLTDINGKPAVLYELHLINFAKDSLEIESLAILNSSDTSTVYSCNRDMLPAHFVRIGKTKKDTAPVLPPGASGVFFL